jgi:hypothetical protein
LLFVGQVTLRFPMTLDSSAWFFPSTVGIIAVILALGAWAMRAAVGKQRLWSEEF